MFAALQFASVINIRRTHAKDGRSIRDIDPITDTESTTSRNSSAEGKQIWIGARTSDLGDFRLRKDPDANTISIRRIFRAMRMAASWVTPILDIDAEQYRLRCSPATAIGPIANSSEDNLIGGSSRLAGPTQTIAWIANAIAYCPGTINSTWTDVSSQANSGQSIKQSRLEVSSAPALSVAHVCPSSMDARITQERIANGRAIHFPKRRAYLATMSNVTHISGVNQRIILSSATSYPGCIWSRAFHTARSLSADHDRFTIDVPSDDCSIRV
jgi:hypothetical protein